jgi:hypothetical protein
MRLVRWLACIVLLLSLRASATWTLVQAWKSTTCGTTTSTCTQTLTAAATAGNLLVVIGTLNLNDPIATVVDSGSSTYVMPSGCAVLEPTAPLYIMCAYTLNVVGGVTTVTITRSTTTSSAWYLRTAEYHSTATESFDVAGATVASTATTAPVGPALTLTGTNDLVIHAIRTATPSAISGGYTFTSFTQGATGYLLNVSSAPTPTWTTTSAKAAMNAFSFKESGAVAQPQVNVITENRAPQ